MRKTRARSLGQEDPLEKAMAPTPVLLPGKSHGRRSLVGYSPLGHKESDMTEWPKKKKKIFKMVQHWRKCDFEYPGTKIGRLHLEEYQLLIALTYSFRELLYPPYYKI